MKIKMLCHYSGALGDFAEGDIAELPDDEAIRLIEAGSALPSATRELERAISNPPRERRASQGKPD